MNPETLEVAEAIAQLTAQIQYFREQALSFRDQAAKAQANLTDYQALLTALMVREKTRKLEITPDLLKKMTRFNGMRMIKTWKNGTLSLELVEKRKKD